MKYIDEYRDRDTVAGMLDRIRSLTTATHRIMEVCGGQTHSIVKFGLDQLLPAGIELIHGPGCPVCVTPVAILDQAMNLARREEVIFCSFGDMLRVPGSAGDLLSTKASGADVRAVYSPLDAVRLAGANPGREVVFLAVGFETTAPANALAVVQAQRQQLDNFTLLVSHVLVPPAMATLLAAPGCGIDGFLAAGHVCTVMGLPEYQALVEKHRVPVVVTGFEPLDILHGVYLCIKQLENGQARLENPYARAVRADGNRTARELIKQVFEVTPRHWRGLGEIPDSGLRLRTDYHKFDAARKFHLAGPEPRDESECISGQIMQGLKKPLDCPAFGGSCTPESPVGAPMVSTEGSCAAYYRYRLHEPADAGGLP